LDGDGNLHLSLSPFKLRGVLSHGAFLFWDDMPARRFPSRRILWKPRILISLKLSPRENQLRSWPSILRVHAMRDGIPHSVAVVLSLVFAGALSLFVVAAWGGFLH